MSQNTVIVVDGTGLEVLEYINDAFNTVITNNSGSSSPTETYAFMTWADTTSGLLKIRNAANTDWITIGTLASTNLGLLPSTAIGTTVQAYDADLAAIASSNAGSQIVSYATNGIGFKNRIINGDMRIDQRNNGASITPNGGVYSVDRWQALSTQASKYTIQQNAGSVTPPAGFTNYLGVTSLSAFTPASTDYFFLHQPIEGFNFADLAWGTASAQPVTLSFWVRSSLTGTFSGSLGNGAENRSYPFNYSISAANTWTQISVTISGDTTGTWTTGNGLGCRVNFNLGSGSNYLGTAGAWAASNLKGATGSVRVISTNGATFYITGVQLEKGSTATPFEVRPYGMELQLCKRYYQDQRCTVPIVGVFAFVRQVTMRAAPSVIWADTGTVTNVYEMVQDSFAIQQAGNGYGVTGRFTAEL